jgi:hypothetical protein
MLWSSAAFAADTYVIKIEAVQPNKPVKSLVLEYSPSKCKIEFKKKVTTIKNEVCRSLFSKYESFLKKENSLFDDVGEHNPFYRLKVQKGSETWTLKIVNSDYELCDLKGKCTAARGSEIRKFISEVNGLIK